jgi:hypothetical protein
MQLPVRSPTNNNIQVNIGITWPAFAWNCSQLTIPTVEGYARVVRRRSTAQQQLARASVVSVMRGCVLGGSVNVAQPLLKRRGLIHGSATR